MNQAEVNAVAEDLGVKPETVLQMERRLSGQDVSFAATASDDEEGAAYAPEQYLASEDADPATALENADWDTRQRKQLADALEHLDDRSRDILNQRWLSEDSKTGLKELAEVYGISAERVRQIEAAAIKKLRKAIAA